MNASQIITDDMSLEEKLKAIDAAIQAAQAAADDQARRNDIKAVGSYEAAVKVYKAVKAVLKFEVVAE